MEEGQNSENQVQQSPSPQPSGVTFPTVGAPKKSGGAKTLLIVGILVLAGILGFVIYKSATKKSDQASTEPSPYDNLTEPSKQVLSATASPVPTPSSANRSKVQIQIQNGTGIPGEAAYLQDQLGTLGYTNIKLDNAADQTGTATQVTFSSTLDSGIISEITQKLKSIYQSVTVSNSGATTYDVLVITGLKKGATSKPSPTPAPAATSSPTPTPSPT